SARAENGGAVVRCDAERLHVRRKIASAVFVSLDTCEAAAARSTRPRGDRRERKGRTDARRAGGAAKIFPALSCNLSQCRKNGRAASATFTGIFPAETRIEWARPADRNAEWVRAGD